MPGNIRKSLLQFIFSGSYMKRWNDKLRPMELIEIDKQAHKMIVAWMLCRLDTNTQSATESLALEEEVIEGGIFDYLFRLVITDIKPPVLYRIKGNSKHYQQLAEWAVAEAEPLVRPLDEDFWRRFSQYVCRATPQGRSGQILAAAHCYASFWEFKLLKPLNDPFDAEMAEIDENFTGRLASFASLTGVPELCKGIVPHGQIGAGAGTLPIHTRDVSALSGFANLCGQLRFQKRWSQTPRIPETSVMGHMFIVACYAYILSIRLGACRARRINNFFCGLFHDLPEMLTRDIISPVKRSFTGLGQLIREYEESELHRRVLSPLEQQGYHALCGRLGYYLGLPTGSEFDDTIMTEHGPRKESFATLQSAFNEDVHDPKDGEAIKICDTLAAYIEAYTAIRNGITSDNVQQAFWRLREQNGKRMLGEFHIGALFTDFD